MKLPPNSPMRSGHPIVWIARPAWNFSSGTSQSSFKPTACPCGVRPSASPRRAARRFVRCPREPSPRTVTFAVTSVGSRYVGFRFPSLSRPFSLTVTPRSAPEPSTMRSSATSPAYISTPSFSHSPASHFTSSERETM